MITVAGLGPAGIDRMSVGARRAVESDAKLFFRTGRHPAAVELAADGVSFETFDTVYESANTFSEVYSKIADRIIEESMAGDVVYCVPGHPLVGEEAVRLILTRAKESGSKVKIIGSESFIEPSLEAVGASMDEGLKIIDALSVPEIGPDTNLPNLFYQVYGQTVASDLKITLLDVYPAEFEVYLIIGAGTKEEYVEKLPLFELDRRRGYDHLTSVYVPRMDEDGQNI